MPPENPLEMPFLTRKQFAFEHGAVFQLSGEVRSSSNRLVRIAGFTKEGPFIFNIQTGAGFAGNTISFALPDFPVAVIVSDDSAVATQGSCYVELNLSVDGAAIMHLCKGYLGPNQPISWPYSPAPAEMQKRGELAVLTTADPAAGAEISLTTEAQSWLKIKTFLATLVTDATAANRTPELRITVNGSIVSRIPPFRAATASQTNVFQWSDAGAGINDTTGLKQLLLIPLDMLLPPGTVLATVTTGLVAGDNWSAAVLYVERFQAL